MKKTGLLIALIFIFTGCGGKGIRILENIKVSSFEDGGLEYGAVSFSLSKTGFYWNNLTLPVTENGKLIGNVKVVGGKESKRGIQFYFHKPYLEEVLAKNGIVNPHLPNGAPIPVTDLPSLKTWVYEAGDVHLYINANPRYEKMLLGVAVNIKELGSIANSMQALTILEIFQVPMVSELVQHVVMGSSGLYFNPQTGRGGIHTFVTVPNIFRGKKVSQKSFEGDNHIQFKKSKDIAFEDRLKILGLMKDVEKNGGKVTLGSDQL